MAGAGNEGGEIARKGGGAGDGDGISIMNNALLKMKTRLRFLDYNPTENSDKSPRGVEAKEAYPSDGRPKL